MPKTDPQETPKVHAPKAKTPSIWVLEDDPALALGLCDALNFEGFAVRHHTLGREALRAAQSDPPDCMIVDLMLPDINGYTVCEELRQHGATFPIIMLTARSQELDKIRGLECGADDYITKPFSLGELIARIRAIFRRTAMSQHAQSSEPLFTIGEAKINTNTQTITRANNTMALSFYEAEILKLLFEYREQPVSREEILEKIWGQSATTQRTVDNFIVKLRKKIEAEPNQPRYILTVYGQGYKLVCT